VLPAVRELEDRLTEQLEAGLDEIRGERTVTRPADVHEGVRALQAVGENIAPYEALFKKLRARIDEELVAEHLAAVGVDKNGIPRENMEVPDEGTTIKFTRDWKTEHDIDTKQAVAANIGLVAHEWALRGEEPAPQALAFAQAVVDSVMETLLGTAGRKVLITQLEGLKGLLGARELDDLAQVAEDAYQGSTTTFSKVKVERVTPLTPKKPARARIARKRAPSK
jgi:hypothetical protein